MRKQLLRITIILFSFAFTSCNESSYGNWSEKDKDSFRSDMLTVKELNEFSESKSEFIECYLKKCESNYSSYASANTDVEGCTRLAIECGEEIFSNGSVKGNWSDDDRLQALLEFQSIEELDLLGDYKSVFIECYLDKCENHFPSLYSANLNEAECEKLAEECYEKIF